MKIKRNYKAASIVGLNSDADARSLYQNQALTMAQQEATLLTSIKEAVQGAQNNIQYAQFRKDLSELASKQLFQTQWQQQDLKNIINDTFAAQPNLQRGIPAIQEYLRIARDTRISVASRKQRIEAGIRQLWLKNHINVNTKEQGFDPVCIL